MSSNRLPGLSPLSLPPLVSLQLMATYMPTLLLAMLVGTGLAWTLAAGLGVGLVLERLSARNAVRRAHEATAVVLGQLQEALDREAKQAEATPPSPNVINLSDRTKH